MVNYVVRPGQLSGCWASWSEKDQPQFIRTSMDVGPPKVRRRTTGVHRIADVSGPILRSEVDIFWEWYRVICQGGIMPTNIVEPNGVESIWRFVEPPTMDWNDVEGRFVTVTAQIERLPGWQEL
jgi:hypothetical protein